MTTINWKGYTWDLRNEGLSGTGFGFWTEENISIDSDGYLNMQVTNPTGIQPRICGMTNTSRGLGYGTYTLVVGTDLTTLDKNIVFGGMYPLENNTPYIEFDVCECSKWDDRYADVYIYHNSYYGSNSSPSYQQGLLQLPSASCYTFQFIWKKNSVIFKSFIGDNANGTPFFSTVFTENIPEPNQERVYLSLWAYSNGVAGVDDVDAPETTVIVRDFNFTPMTYSAGTSMIRGVSNGKYNR